MSQAKSLFFLGKGGVGKSTSSALMALYLAQNGFKTRLVSMDPAHNQGDIFERKLSDKFVKLRDNLWAKEVSIDRGVKDYLAGIQAQVKRSYSYLTAFNLEHYLNILKFSPGIEEYALMMAYQNIRKEADDVDYIVFDMPPTALTLKFFTLPDVSLLWLKNLLMLRNKIIEKKEIIARVKLGKKEIDTDKIRSNLEKQIAEYESIKKVFADQTTTSLNLVVNPDKLSFSESQLIMNKLLDYDISISKLFLNKWKEGAIVPELPHQFKSGEIQKFPASESPLLGINELTQYLQRIADFVEI